MKTLIYPSLIVVVMPDTVESDESNLANMVRSDSKAIFNDKVLLEPSRIVKDNRIVGREDQKRQMVEMIRPIMQGSSPPNILAYGPSGTGKSLITQRVLQEFNTALSERGEDMAIIEVNCRWIKTLHQAAMKISESVEALDNVDTAINSNGKSTRQVFTESFKVLEDNYDCCVFVVDEVDTLRNPNSKPDEEKPFSSLLYILTRIDELVGMYRTSVVALTNNPDFMDDVDGRAESSFNPRNILFSDYDSNQLQAILRKREDAFHDDVLSDDVIPLSSALAARNNGDARKAIDLIRTAGEIAIRETSSMVTDEYVYEAQDEVEKDLVLEIASGYAMSKQIVLFSAALADSLSSNSYDTVPNPVLEEVYAVVHNKMGSTDQPKSNDTILRYMSEYEMNGIIESSRTGRGFSGGMYKQYMFCRPSNYVIDILSAQDERFEDLLHRDNSDFLNSVISSQFDKFYNGR